MPVDESPENSSSSTRRRFWKWVAGVAAAVLIAGLTAIASGLGTKTADKLIASESELVSHSEEEQGYECGSVTFLPTAEAEPTSAGPAPSNWHAFQYQPGAAFSERDVVQVSIQGESARIVTLTGIRFSVKRRERPDGATFSAPCGGGINGRGLRVDVEANPPQILASSESEEGSVESGGMPGSDTPPIEFPWTVSLTDPLLLYVVATADSCYCTWTAEIPWVSGGEKGTIRIDNEGRGYTVVGSTGLPGYTLGGVDWEQYRAADGSPPN